MGTPNNDFWGGYKAQPAVRERLLRALADAWAKHPHERFGQFLSNLDIGSIPWHAIWDEELTQVLIGQNLPAPTEEK